MRSQKGIREMESRTISTGVPHINLGILKNFPVPIPPLELQQEFTRVVDSVEAQKARMWGTSPNWTPFSPPFSPPHSMGSAHSMGSLDRQETLCFVAKNGYN